MGRFVRSRRTRQKLSRLARRSSFNKLALAGQGKKASTDVPSDGDCEVPYEAAPSDAAPWLHVPRGGGAHGEGGRK